MPNKLWEELCMTPEEAQKLIDQLKLRRMGLFVDLNNAYGDGTKAFFRERLQQNRSLLDAIEQNFIPKEQRNEISDDVLAGKCGDVNCRQCGTRSVLSDAGSDRSPE